MALAHGINELKGKAVVAIKKQTNWTSVFSAIPGVTSDQFRTWFRDAGVHVYTDCEDVLSVNESWLMLHTQTDGIKQITLPQKSKKITEITTEKSNRREYRPILDRSAKTQHGSVLDGIGAASILILYSKYFVSP